MEKYAREIIEYTDLFFSVMETLFKEYDKLGSRAVSRDDMKKIIDIVVPNFSQEEELEEMMDQYVAG